MPTNHSAQSKAEATTRGKASEFTNTKNTSKVADRKTIPAKSKSGTAAALQQRPEPRSTTGEGDAIRLRVQHYLDGYCHALLEGDTKTLASMWAIPAFVVDARNSRVINDRAEVEQFFSGAQAMYEKRGIVETRAEVESLDVIRDNLVMVLVRWPYVDESGDAVGSELATYTLKANEDGEFKLCVCTMRGDTQSSDEHH